MTEQDLVFRLRERARIRRQIKDRKSVQEGKPDRISDLLEEAATEIEILRKWVEDCHRCSLKPLPTGLSGDTMDGPMIKMFRED